MVKAEEESDVSSSSIEELSKAHLPPKQESDVSELDKDFLKAFAKIKQRDASIYNPDSRLFDAGGSASDAGDSDGEENADNDDSGSNKKRHPKFLRQVLAEQALEGGTDSDSDEAAGAARPQTYTQEQQDVKSAFLEAAGEVDEELGDGEFGAVLKRGADKGQAAEQAGQNDPVIKELLVKCFGGDAAASKEDAFLRDYVQRQQWRTGEEPSELPLPVDDVAAANVDLEADLEHEQNAERFEATFNFRFEEPGGADMVAHPREVEGIVRKKDERRKLARERRAKRKEEELRQQEQEAKQARKAARAAKRAEKARQPSQMEQVREAAGEAGPDEARLAALMGDDDWDPAAYDAAMASAFGEDYYDAADELEGQGAEDQDEDGGAAPGDTLAADAQPSPEREQPGNDLMQEDDSDSDVDVPAPPGRSRFHYRQVPKADYGLNIEDILGLDSKELNQVVSLKRLAPYREERRAWADRVKLQELRDAAAAKPHRKGRPEQLVIRRQRQRPSRLVLPHGGDGMQINGTAPAQASHPKKGAVDSAPPAAQQSTPSPSVERLQKSDAERAAAKTEREKKQRLQSYGKLTLKQDGGKGVKRKAESAAVLDPVVEGLGLSRGERKRLKRSQKRAEKRAVAA